jgi:hypothetical protein
MLVLRERKTLSIPLSIIKVHMFNGDFDFLSVGRLSHNKRPIKNGQMCNKKGSHVKILMIKSNMVEMLGTLIKNYL